MKAVIRKRVKRFHVSRLRCHMVATVAVGMSGGIDSAVSAMLLKDQGYNVIGVFMKNWDSSDERGTETCPIESDREDMRAVCERLDIPTHDVQFIKEYWNDVFEPFLTAYQSGVMTPNPDVYCNRHIKFKRFREYAFDKLNVDYIATGHYVRVRHFNVDNSSIVQLLCGLDKEKDQSYFLSMTPGEQLKRCLFPVGDKLKPEVKQLAADRLQGLRVLSKKESTGVCFIGERNMASFLGDYMTVRPGRFIDIDTGKILGNHLGKELYTIGQKARISSQSDKYYIAKKSSRHDDIFVARGSNNPQLYSDHAYVLLQDFSWVSGTTPDEIEKATNHLQKNPDKLSEEALNMSSLSCKIRYREPSIPCKLILSKMKSYSNSYLLKIQLSNLSLLPAPGQIAVLYDGDVCLGGGVILNIDDDS